LLAPITGCSDKASEQKAQTGGEPQHVWKDQVKALDKAKHLEADMDEAFKNKQKEIDRQTR